MLLSCGMWSSNSEGKTELTVEMILYEVKCQWDGPIKLGVMHCKKQDQAQLARGILAVFYICHPKLGTIRVRSKIATHVLYNIV